jgi:radical SAM protein with 4Fe4S-binding SPASM domain
VLELAHRERFLVNLLTTGIRVGPAEVKHFSRTGVRSVEMSVLGATAQTHDRLMGCPGAFDRTVRAARLLREAGIPVALKATVLTGNHREIEAMRELAQGLGAGFSASSLVVAGVDGDPEPLRWALGAGEAADAEEGCIERGPEASGAVLTCKAGKSHAAIAPNGDVLPCVLFRRPVGNVRRQTVREVWHDAVDPFLRRLRELRPEDVGECFACAQRSECRRCPALAYADRKDITARVDRGCLLIE